MKKSYKHLSLGEREKYYALKEQGYSLRKIGKKLGRSHTTFARERRRNAKYGQQYIPCKADEKAMKRAKKQREKAPLKKPLIFLYVRIHLRDGWSPETIAGRLSIDYPDESIHHESIYRYIYGPYTRGMKLWQYLTLRRKRRRKRNGRGIRRDKSKIPNAASIDHRPNEAETRKIPGHWETDNMEGIRSDKKTASVTVERMTRYTLLSKLKNRTAFAKTDAVVSRLAPFPGKVKRSITADNGAENSYHTKITASLKMSVFFCHPYHSWERGSVENMIGRIRRFIPKGASIDQVPEEDLAAIELLLNSTPRKCLGYKTPDEKMREVLGYG